jgi:predicted nucleotidyltransferase
MNISRNRFEITPDQMARFLSKNLKVLFKEYKIDFVYLGGSWARNQNQWWSDLDIFISMPSFSSLSPQEQLTLLTKLHLKITELIRIEEVDISVIETLPLHVKFQVIAEGILIYENPTGKRAEFVEKLLPYYYDHMIWFKRLLKESKYITKEKG